MGMQNTLPSDSALEVSSLRGERKVSSSPSVRPGGRKSSAMEELFEKVSMGVAKIGEVVEGVMLAKDGARLFVDLGIHGVGIIYGREYLSSREIVKTLKPGDKIMMKILELENEDGYIELSLREAGRDLVWREAGEWLSLIHI